MSVRVMSLVWDADLGSPTRKLIALKLADCANDNGESIRPSIATIAAATGLCRSAVEKALAALRRDGLLCPTRRGGARNGPTRYRMNLSWLHARSMKHELHGATYEVRGGSVPRTQNPSVEPREPNRKRIHRDVPVSGGDEATLTTRNPLDAWGRA